MSSDVRLEMHIISMFRVTIREMTISLSKRRELRTKVKSLQQELTKVSMERNFLLDEREKGRYVALFDKSWKYFDELSCLPLYVTFQEIGGMLSGLRR